VLKFAIALALIVIVLHAFDVKGVMSHFARIDAPTLAVAIVLALAISLLHTARWLAVLAVAKARLGFKPALQIVLIGHFFNQALPSSVGGDVVRIWCGYRAGLSMATSANTVAVDRALTLLSLPLLTLAGLPWLFDIVTDPVARWALSTVILASFAGFAAFLAVTRLPQAIGHWRVSRALLNLVALTRAVVSDTRALFATVFLSVLSFVVFSFIVYQLARAMHIDISLLDCVLLVPPVILVSVLPVSIAGWGVREGAMVVAFGFVHVPPGAAFAVSVLFGLTLAVASLPGSLLWWMSGYSVDRVAAESATLGARGETGG